MKCPKCQYVRTSTDTAPDYECPKCGIVYAKVLAASPADTAKRSAVIREVDADHEDFTESGIYTKRERKFIAIALAIGLVIGYFLGREHVKYELRSAMQAVAVDMTKNLKKVFGGTGANPIADTKTSAQTSAIFPITAALIKKGFFEGEYGKNAVTFTVTFANSTGKDVRAFDGILTFSDLLGNEIYGAKLAINDPVQTGQILNWDGKLDYNQFIASHESLKNAEVQNIKVKLVLKKVLFESGETKEY